MCKGLNLPYILQENDKKNPTTDRNEGEISSQAFKTTRICCHILNWGRRDTAFPMDKWFIQHLQTTLVGTSWLLLLKPHLLTRQYESSDNNNNKADFCCWEIPARAKEVAGTYFSTLILNTQLGL